MGAWGRRGGAFGVAALGGQADRALDRLGGATQRQPGARGAGGRGAGNQELQSYVQHLDSGLVDEDQEPPDELNYLTEDDLSSELPSSDVALREREGFLRQNQQDPGPHSGSDDPSDSA